MMRDFRLCCSNKVHNRQMELHLMVGLKVSNTSTLACTKSPRQQNQVLHFRKLAALSHLILKAHVIGRTLVLAGKSDLLNTVAFWSGPWKQFILTRSVNFHCHNKLRLIWSTHSLLIIWEIWIGPLFTFLSHTCKHIEIGEDQLSDQAVRYWDQQ